METFQKQLHLPVTRIDDSKRMLAALKVDLQLCADNPSLLLDCLPCSLPSISCNTLRVLIGLLASSEVRGCRLKPKEEVEHQAKIVACCAFTLQQA